MKIASKLALCAALGLGSLATTAQSADFVNVLTGGTSGVAYLRRMLEVELIPELWHVRGAL